MGTKIEWTELTWNPSTGCTQCSPGCDNCYAKRMVKRLQHIPESAQKYRNGFAYTEHPTAVSAPLGIKKPHMIFVNSMSDTFHEKATDKHLEATFRVMGNCPQHTFQVLTKRPENIPDWLKWPKNVWLGVTVCNPSELWKIEKALQIHATLIFVSIEPMLAYLDISGYLASSDGFVATPTGPMHVNDGARGLGWVIVGGENGPGARIMPPEWVRNIQEQCAVASVPFFFKGWGEWCTRGQIPARNQEKILRAKRQGDFYRVGRKFSGRLLYGKLYDQFPETGC